MKSVLVVAAVSIFSIAGPASAKGCVSGAAVGGVAGHVAGRHALLGAAAGCAINHHRNAVKDAKATASSGQRQMPATPESTTVPAKQN